MHLGRSRYPDAVEQCFVLAEETLSEVAQLQRLDRGIDRTVEHDAAIDRAGADAVAGGQLIDGLAQTGQVVLDGDQGAQQDLIVLVDRVQAGRSGPPTEQVDDAGRLGLDVGDLGIGDEHGSRRLRQADDLALAYLDRERALGADCLGRALAVGGRGEQPEQQGQAGAQGMPPGARGEAPAPAAKRIGGHQLPPSWS